MHSLYQYAFSAKDVIRERAVGQNAAGRLSRAYAAFLWTHHAITFVVGKFCESDSSKYNLSVFLSLAILRYNYSLFLLLFISIIIVNSKELIKSKEFGLVKLEKIASSAPA